MAGLRRWDGSSMASVAPAAAATAASATSEDPLDDVRVYCFGNTTNGELGLGGIEDDRILAPRQQKLLPSLIQSAYALVTTTPREDSSRISALSSLVVRQISSGRNHTLVLLSDSKNENLSLVLSCGSNERCQLGREGSWRKLEIIRSLAQHIISEVACGANFSLALNRAGQVFSWGCNLFGQLGVGKTDDDAVLKPGLVKKLAAETVVAIACGGNHSLALTQTGLLYVFGSNAFGQLGLGTLGNCVFYPVQVAPMDSVAIKQISAGGSHSVCLSVTGALYVWGKNEFGTLGLRDTRTRSVPTVQPALRTHQIDFVSCGEDHTAAISRDGKLFTWGAGMYGQLGHGTNNNETLPRCVFELMGFKVIQVSCGRCHTLAAIGERNRVYAFGLNGCGQLGLGTPISKSLPSRVSGPWVENGNREVAIPEKPGPLVSLPTSPYFKKKKRLNTVGDDASILDTVPKDLSKGILESESQYLSRRSTSPPSHSKSSSPMAIDIENDCEDGNVPLDYYADEDSMVIEEPDEILLNRSSSSGSPGGPRLPHFVASSETNFRAKYNDFKINEIQHDDDQSSDESEIPEPALSLKMHFVLQEIAASRGDQSFVITNRLHTNPSNNHPSVFPVSFQEPVDFRLIPCPLSTLNNDSMRQLAAFGAEEPLTAEVLDYIENTFPNLACWNASYVSSGHFSSSAAMDWDAAAEGFSLLESVSNERIKSLVNDIIVDQLLPRIASTSRTTAQDHEDFESMRVFLLLPMYHVFHSVTDGLAKTTKEKIDNITRLVAPFAKAFLQQRKSHIETIQSWWSLMDKKYYHDLVHIFKRSAVTCLEEQRRKLEEDPNRQEMSSYELWIHQNLRHCLEILKKICQVNHKKHFLDYKEFYIEGICDLVDIKSDYVFWLAHRQGALVVRGHQPLFMCDFPFIFDVEAKTKILQTDSLIQQQNAAEAAMYQGMVLAPDTYGRLIPVATQSPFLDISVRRGPDIVQDTIDQLVYTPNLNYKKPLKIEFRGEEAVDAGAGVKKEFFLFLMRELLDPKYGMFVDYEDTHSIWFNPGEQEELTMYELIGIMCGLAIYNKVIIFLPFPQVLYKKLLSEPLDLGDMASLDPVVARNLQEMLDTEYSASEFDAIYGDLNFTVTLSCYGHPTEFELCPGGRDKAVSYENRAEYVRLHWEMILNKSVENQYVAFAKGVHKVLDLQILSLFRAEELQQLIVGQENYSWPELEKNCIYKPPFSATHPTIRKFWRVFHTDLSHVEKKRFLKFLTGSDRIPISGMKSLNMAIQPMKVSSDFLPVAHTCFNLLDLPEEITDEAILRKKLLTAIEHTEGFTLA